MAYTRVQAGDDVTPEQINDVYDSMEKLEAISAEVVETLPAGSPATAQVVTDGSGNKKLELKIPQGATGVTGNGIASVELTSSVGNIDTYTITFTSGTTMTFQVTNGTDGADGVGYRAKGSWSSTTEYVNNSEYIDTVLSSNGNQYYCKVTNTNKLPQNNPTEWGLFVIKGADGEGTGNAYASNSNNVSSTEVYGFQPSEPIPETSGGNISGEFVKVQKKGTPIWDSETGATSATSLTLINGHIYDIYFGGNDYITKIRILKNLTSGNICGGIEYDSLNSETVMMYMSVSDTAVLASAVLFGDENTPASTWDYFKLFKIIDMGEMPLNEVL